MIKLESGREIRLERLNQEKTYANLLKGLPRITFNNHIIESWRRRYESSGLVVIEPVRKRDPNRKGQPDDDIWGPVEFLPPIVFVGMFQSEPVLPSRSFHFHDEI